MVNINGSILLPLMLYTNNSSTGGVSRVFAFIFSAAMLVSPIALMVAGPFADAVGIQPWFLVAGISCMAMGILGFFSADVMKMESNNTEGNDQVTAPQA